MRRIGAQPGGGEREQRIASPGRHQTTLPSGEEPAASTTAVSETKKTRHATIRSGYASPAIRRRSLPDSSSYKFSSFFRNWPV